MKKMRYFFKKNRISIFLCFCFYILFFALIYSKPPSPASKSAKKPRSEKSDGTKAISSSKQSKSTDTRSVSNGQKVSNLNSQNKDKDGGKDSSKIEAEVSLEIIEPKNIPLSGISSSNQESIKAAFEKAKASLLLIGKKDTNFIPFLNTYNLLVDEAKLLRKNEDVFKLVIKIEELYKEIEKIITKNKGSSKLDFEKNMTLFINIEKASRDWLKNSLNKFLVSNVFCNYYFFQLVLRFYDPALIGNDLTEMTNLIKVTNHYLVQLDNIIHNFLSKKESMEGSLNLTRAWLKKTNLFISLSRFNIVENGDHLLIAFNRGHSPIVIEGTTFRGGFLLQADFHTLYPYAVLCHDSGALLLFFFDGKDTKLKPTDNQILENIKIALASYNSASNRVPLILATADISSSPTFVIKEIPETDFKKNPNFHPGFLTFNFNKEFKFLPDKKSFNFGRHSENIKDVIRFFIGVDIDWNKSFSFIKESLSNLGANISSHFKPLVFNTLQQKMMVDNLKLYDKVLRHADHDYPRHLDTSDHVQILINKLQEDKKKNPINADQIDHAIEALSFYKNSKK